MSTQTMKQRLEALESWRDAGVNALAGTPTISDRVDALESRLAVVESRGVYKPTPPESPDLPELTPIISGERFAIDEKARTFRDVEIGLTWQLDMAEGMTWQRANEYAAGLQLAGGGWRLPTIQELLTLVDHEAAGPATWPALRQYTPCDCVWSDTQSPQGGAGSVWFVSFYNGYSGYHGVDNGNRVRCVR